MYRAPLRYVLVPVIFIIACTINCFATDHSSENINSDEQTNTTKAKIQVLCTAANKYAEKEDWEANDSLLAIAVEAAELNDNDSLLMSVYRQIFSNRVNNLSNENEVREYVRNMLSIAQASSNNLWLYYSYYADAIINLQFDNSQSAIDKITKANYYVNLVNSDALKAECFLLWGKCLEKTNNKIDAFRNYLNALYLAQKLKNKDLVFQCYNNLSFFYLLIGNYERARDYKIKQFALLPDLKTGHDSDKIMSLYSDLSVRYYYNRERQNAEKITNRIIDYATRTHNADLMDLAVARHINFLTENSLFKEIADFYQREHPDELKKLAMNDSEKYCRVMGYISEADGNLTDAEHYFGAAETIILRNKPNSSIYCSNFLKRYGQFLIRCGKLDAAKQKMQASYIAAKEADYLPYLIETSHYLDSLNYVTGHLAQAYEYAKLNKEYSDRQDIATKEGAILHMEIENETKQRELKQHQEEEETEHRHNLQYTGIIFTIITAFIILIMMGVFKVSKVLIRSLGFISFIFFFEFIILLLDHKIMEITHHEPWKMLAIKVVIISMLLPFHHWLEHKVTHYLIEHKLVDAKWLNGRKFWKKNPVPAQKELPDSSES